MAADRVTDAMVAAAIKAQSDFYEDESNYYDCPTCKGTGIVDCDWCPKCGGTGRWSDFTEEDVMRKAVEAALRAEAGSVGDLNFQKLADGAYVEYTRKMRTDDCLGSDAKMAAGKFNGFNLQAFIEAGRLLGMHQAWSRAATALAQARRTDRE
jgi:hypothetical protein